MADETLSQEDKLQFLPKHLRDKLLQFQKEGVCYALNQNGRCLFGDEMGLGKTIQAISVAYYYKSEWPLLIVVPSSMRYPWTEELEKWLPELQPNDINLITSGTDIRSIPCARISIVGYGLFRNGGTTLLKALTEQDYRIIIVDESHYLKNRQAARTKLLVPLLHKALRVIMLTGTPALGRPAELFTQIDSIKKGFFGTWLQFAKRFCNARWRHFGRQRMWDTTGASHLGELHKLLTNSVMIRREKSQVLTQLPPKRRQKVPFELADSAEKKHLEKCWSELDGLMNPRDAVLDELNNSHFEVKRLAMEMYTLTAKAKIGAVCEYVKMLLENQEMKFLVFAHHKEVLTAVAQTVAAYAKEHKTQLKYIRIDGDVPSSQRMHLVNQFQTDDKTRVAVLSIMAAGTGLTLTAATQVVFAELHWTPGVLEQCEDRAHRIGQHNAIHVHYLVARGTIDEWLWSSLSRKVNVLSSALNGKLRHLRMEEKGEDEVQFLKYAAAWLPSNRDLEDDESFYFADKKTNSSSQDIRHFFTPGNETSASKKRKRDRPSRKSTETHSEDSSMTETIFSEDDDDFKSAKKHRTDSQCSRNPASVQSSVERAGHLGVSTRTRSAKTPINRLHATPVSCTVGETERSERPDSHDLHQDNLPDMKSNSKRRRKLTAEKLDTRRNDRPKSSWIFKEETTTTLRSASCTTGETCECNSQDDDAKNKSKHPRIGLTEEENTTPIRSARPINRGCFSQRFRDNAKNLPESGCLTTEDKDAAASRGSDLWSCLACTFNNHADLPFCEICNTPKKITRSRKSTRQSNIGTRMEKPSSMDNSRDLTDEVASLSPGSLKAAVIAVSEAAHKAVDGGGPSSQRETGVILSETITDGSTTEDYSIRGYDSDTTDSYDYPQVEIPDESSCQLSLTCAKPESSSPASDTETNDVDFDQEIREATACYLALASKAAAAADAWHCDDVSCGHFNTKDGSDCEACWSPRRRSDALLRRGTADEKTNAVGKRASPNPPKHDGSRVRSDNPNNSVESCTQSVRIKSEEGTNTSTHGGQRQCSDNDEPKVHQGEHSGLMEESTESKPSMDSVNNPRSGDGGAGVTDTDAPAIQQYEAFQYCLSKYTERIYLYDQDSVPLNCSFQAIDLQHRDLSALPPVLHHPQNLRVALRFLREWNSLNEVKRRQLRKSGAVFISPLTALEATKRQLQCQPSTKRFITKDDLADAARKTAESVGGTVRVISMRRPTAAAAGRFLQGSSHDRSDSSQSSGNEGHVSILSKSPVRCNAIGTPIAVTRKNSNDTGSPQPGTASSPTVIAVKSPPKSATSPTAVKRGTFVQAVDGQGRPLCVYCGEVTAQSTASETHYRAAWDMRYCSQTCKEEHSLRWKSTAYVRQQLLEAEHGVCQLCSVNAQQLYASVKDAAKSERKDILEQSSFSKLPSPRLNDIIRNPSPGQFWHADHIVAVMEGGGLCSLDNFRTLCILCHEKVTAEQNARRRSRQRAAGTVDIRSFFNP